MSIFTGFCNYKVMRGNKVLFVIAVPGKPFGTGMTIPLLLKMPYRNSKRLYITLPYKYLKTDLAGNIYQVEFALNANRKSDRQLRMLNDALGVTE